MNSPFVYASARISGFLALAIGSTLAQSKQDSGWVSLYNGKDFTGFYTFFAGEGVVDLKTQDAFFAEDSIIHVPKGKATGYSSKQGQLTTIKQYGWYKVRVDYRFAPDTGEVNAGLIIHTHNASAFDGTARYGLRPLSIEINMRRYEASPWTLWSAGSLGPYISTTVKSGTNQYQAKTDGGVDWTNDPWKQRIVASSYPNPEKPPGEWNHGEAWIYGDSLGEFYLNGQLRTRGWNFRKRVSPDDSTVSKRLPVDSGGIALQAERFEIWYKNFEIMELEPHTLRPLHAKPTTRINGESAGKKRLKKGPIKSILRTSLDGRKIPLKK